TLSNLLYRQAAAALKNEEKGIAEKKFRECLEIRQSLLKADPGNFYRQDEVMLALARCGEHHEAAAIARDFESRAQNDKRLEAQFLFFRRAPFGFALCADAVVQSPAGAPPPLTAHKQRQEYLGRAIDLLEKAVALGYNDVDELRRDPDFDPLRGDE